MAGKFRQIQKKILSIKSTVKITRAMELVAASRIVKAQNRLGQARPYAGRIRQAIQELAGVSEVATEFPLLKPRPEIKTTGIVVITSDRGLAGSYNSNVIKIGDILLGEASSAGRETKLYVVGKKGLSSFKFRGFPIHWDVQGISDTPRFEDAETLGDLLVKDFIDGSLDEVRIAYTEFRSAGSQVARSIQILPIQKEELGIDDQAPKITPLYEFEPEPGVILSQLLPRYVNTVIFACLLESSASEHAARRRAMKAATENGEELAKLYTRIANRERQAEITNEIMEVVGGAEALQEKEEAGV
ncbi:MAG TPA: F0F1 ATP synthase subunit gamma [Actinomycetota bacterium]|nr:F0F1 ATP synthase subunit gamma [Actinomycetota bacterium]